ncbi:hypothetical protein NL676_023561 [Syzygium grande]|nr:hypothetical protein NL676_023561 [Syzygium grande]
MIKKRYVYLTEEMLKENPSICAYTEPSLDARQDMVVVEVPKLGKEAATKAIKEWGQPESKFTHSVFCTACSVDMPGTDYPLAKLLGLRPSGEAAHDVPARQWCGGHSHPTGQGPGREQQGGAASSWRAPRSTPSPSAGQVRPTWIVSWARPCLGMEQLPSSWDQTRCPEWRSRCTSWPSRPERYSQTAPRAINGHFREYGFVFHLLNDVSRLILENIEKGLAEAFQPLGI